jgi:hypothetical protein
MIINDIFIYAQTWILSFWEVALDTPHVEKFFASHRFYVSNFPFISNFTNCGFGFVFPPFSVVFTEKLVATAPRDPHLVGSGM